MVGYTVSTMILCKFYQDVSFSSVVCIIQMTQKQPGGIVSIETPDLGKDRSVRKRSNHPQLDIHFPALIFWINSSTHLCFFLTLTVREISRVAHLRSSFASVSTVHLKFKIIYEKMGDRDLITCHSVTLKQFYPFTSHQFSFCRHVIFNIRDMTLEIYFCRP